jgi:uncharacterized membrane protein YhaH (DUF805 family)
MKQTGNLNMFGWWKKVVFENYANFSGRARRSEYWYFTLANFIFYVAIYIFIAAVVKLSEPSVILGLINMLVALALFIPSLAVSVRRLHDIGKSGWHFLISLIPIIGSILILVWFFTEGNRGTNEYGEDPKNPDGPVFEFEQKAY